MFIPQEERSTVAVNEPPKRRRSVAVNPSWNPALFIFQDGQRIASEDAAKLPEIVEAVTVLGGRFVGGAGRLSGALSDATIFG